MIQQALFAKSTKFRRPKRTTSRWGDKRRIWRLVDGSGLVVESTGICGVSMPKHYHAIVLVDGRESLISRHKRLRPAQAAVLKATDPKPTKRKAKR